jgi:hypothetical protein
MDPYLERHWLDVHTRLTTYAADWLNERLPEGLVATTEERVAIESGADGPHRVGPDVSVYSPVSPHRMGSLVLDAPYRLILDLDPVTERFIRIIDAAGEHLITVIEFISPTNKTGEGLEDYRRKRSQLLAGGVHVVEVDLVRQGDWRRLQRPYSTPVDAVAPYRAIVYTATPNDIGYLFPIRLTEPLPEIPVPLRPTDTPVRLPLQTLLDQVYAHGRYTQRLDYTQPCEPPLSSEDAAWATRVVQAARV